MHLYKKNTSKPFKNTDSESNLGQPELQYFRFEFSAVAKIGWVPQQTPLEKRG
jgi:hypothetical protein